MTHNTREVEDIVDELYSLAWQDGREGLNRRSALNERFQSAIHHQLQKARADWLRSEIEKLEGMKQFPTTHDTCSVDDYGWCYDHRETIEDGFPNGATEFNKALQTIIDRYNEELDQDKALQDNK